MIHLEESININELQPSNSLEILGLTSSSDRYAFAFANLTYPRSFNCNDLSYFEFHVPESDLQLLSIKAYDHQGIAPTIYDFGTNTKLIAEINGDQILVNLLTSTEPRKVVILNQSQIKTVDRIEKVNFKSFDDQNANYIIITHNKFNRDQGTSNPIEEYANFRSSVLGGSYQVQVIDIEDIYQSFAYGVSRHPIAVRNFTNYMIKNWSNPEFIFLIGKGRAYTEIRKESQLIHPDNEHFYLPTFGWPGADNLLVGKQFSNLPQIAVGRLAASTPADVKIYLEKIKALAINQTAGSQSIENRAWMKEIIHLASGDVSIQQFIQNSMEGFEEIIENEGSFGGNVNTYLKNNTDPIQISVSDRIFEDINNGASMITFYGHSSPGTFDFNIDNPENYFNEGKYPLLISLGCYSGDIHTQEVGISERFVFYDKKGASSFLASTGAGYITSLTTFGNELYKNISDDNYGETLGQIIKTTLTSISQSPSTFLGTLVQQMTLNGDPALRLNPRPGPDYIIDNTKVNFTPEVINNDLEEFQLNATIINLGQNTGDSLRVHIFQEYPNGQKDLVVDQLIPAIPNRSEVTFNIKLQPDVSSGLNKFFIELDPANKLAEFPAPAAESNNSYSAPNGNNFIEKFIYDAAIRPLAPCDYAIQSNDDFQLQAFTNYIRNQQRDFIFQIDSSSSFNSSLFEQGVVTSDGGLISWTPEKFKAVTDKVFYWRVAPDILSNDNTYAWRSASFLYAPGIAPGWNQSTPQQQRSNQFTNLEIDDAGKFKFIDDFLDIRVINKVIEGAAYPEFQFNGNNFTEMFWPYPTATMRVAVFNETGQFWKTDHPDGPFMVENPFPGQPPLISFIWPTDTEQGRKYLMDFIDQTIPDNHTVIVYSSLRNYTTGADLSIEQWANDSISFGKNIFQILEANGATQIRKMETLGTLPYTFIFKKGVGPIKEELANELTDILYTEHSIQGLWTEGSAKSTFIGPASNWDSFEFELENFDNFVNDSFYFDIYGSKNGRIDSLLLLDSITSPQDLSIINAENFPYLRIEYFAKDAEDRTAPHLKFSRVLFTGVPDLVVHPQEVYLTPEDTIIQGNPLALQLAVTNIGTAITDTTALNLSLTDQENNNYVVSKSIPPLNNGATSVTEFEVPTRTTAGRNVIKFEVNPSQAIKEKKYFNNILIDQSIVNVDQTPPLLDVTFDGIHIMNGDLVSANPEITISLSDDNPFFPISDTSNFQIFIIDPNQQTQQVKFNQEEVEFYPAQNNKNEAFVIINKLFEQDGLYKLIVSANDESENAAGDYAYKVTFNVINEQRISNVLNYPNPFSSSTRFVYTLTGDRPPAQFKIQIFSISGNLVHELSEKELGPLQVGNHQTEYAWDGTDFYGDRLANGVYLYRMVSLDESGTAIKRKTNERVDKFYKNGFNKLVILR